VASPEKNKDYENHILSRKAVKQHVIYLLFIIIICAAFGWWFSEVYDLDIEQLKHELAVWVVDINSERFQETVVGMVRLKDIDIVRSSEPWRDGFRNTFNYFVTVQDNFGATYDNAIGRRNQSSAPDWQEYNLNGRFQALEGRLVLNRDVRTSTASTETYFTVFGDGQLLFRSPSVYPRMQPYDFSVDLRGVQTLYVGIYGDRNMLRLVDVVMYTEAFAGTRPFSSAQRNTPSGRTVNLIALDWFYANDIQGFITFDSVRDNAGTAIYANGLGGRFAWRQTESFVEYFVDGDFARFTGRVVLAYEERDRQSDITYLFVYGDDELLYRSPLVTAGMQPADFDLNISNISILRVEIHGHGELRLVDAVLHR
jgi:hypothetical protein